MSFEAWASYIEVTEGRTPHIVEYNEMIEAELLHEAAFDIMEEEGPC